MACLGLFWPGGAAADVQVFARGWTHTSYGRLVLDDAARLVTRVQIEGRTLVIEFSEPVTLNADRALQNLQTYIARPSDTAGTRLEFTLAQPATFRRFEDEGNLAIDLRPAPDPSTADPVDALLAEFQTDAGATQPAQATGPEVAPVPNVTAAPPRIVARHGDHATYMRLALDWPSRISYRITREGDRIEVAFTAPAEIDLKRALVDLPKELVQIAATNDRVAHLYLTLAPGASLRDFRLGRTVVLDIVRPAKLTASAPPLVLPQPGAAPQEGTQPATQPATVAAAPEAQAPKPEPKPEPKPTTNTVAEGPAAAPADAPQLVMKTLPAMPEALPEAPTQNATPTAPQNQAENQPETLPEMPAVEQVVSPPRAPVNVQVNVAPTPNGAKIMFTWPEPIAAAAFRHDNAVWLAFDLPASSINAVLNDARVAKLGKAERIDVPDATILRIAESGPLSIALTASGKSWIVDLAPGGKDAPVAVIDQRRETLADGAASVLLQTNRPGRVISLPALGDNGRLHVVPVRSPGLGIEAEAAAPEYTLLRTHQGIVVASAGDAVSVESLSQGVVITTKPTMAPIAEGPEQPAEEGEQTAAVEPAPDGAGEEAPGDGQAKGKAEKKEPEPLIASVPGLFDLPTWRRGGEATFNNDRKQLERAVSSSSGTERAGARMALGEFYFAHGLLDEAQGALDGLSEQEQGQVDARELALLLGAIATLQGEYDAAHARLDDTSLDDAPEAHLFRGVLAAREANWPEAAQHFGEPLPNIADYPKPTRSQIYLLGGTALNNAGNPVGAQRWADSLKLDQPSREDKDRMTYLVGHIKLKLGERPEALALWSQLADSPVDEIQAHSQYDLVEERLKAGEIKPAEAIKPLEALRFVNRGGDFEFNLLRKLGGLYLGDNQPRKGLVALRQAAANFADRPEAKEVGEEMSLAFRALYLDDGADKLSPLTAVALYDEFRELTPAGADGDRMITKLADRLVKVDLLSRAAELLDAQVKKRLTGLDKVNAGTRLAAIRLLDQKPELALVALRDSEIEGAVPPEIAAERNRLKARATFDAGDTLGGIQMLQGDDSLDAKWLVADMQWRVREWPAAADALGTLIEGEEQAMAAEREDAKKAMDVTRDPAAAVGSAEAEAALKARQDQRFKERIAPLVLNRAIALSLASDRRGLKALANQYGKQMEPTEQAKAFAMLTAPDNGLVESVSAELAGVDRIDAFVTEYRDRLKKTSLSEAPAAPEGGT